MTEASVSSGRQSRSKRGRASRGAVLFLLTFVALASTSPAAPTVKFKVKPRPIPGFPGTGNILGAGIDVEAQYTITGTEYGGSPSPLTELVIDTPAGAKVEPGGFATCAPSILELSGPAGCPKGSKAGPLGEGLGAVTFGTERVDEKVSLQPFFAPDNGLTFYLAGSVPVSLQVVEKAHWVPASPPFGPKLIVEIPLILSAPGGYNASVLSFDVQVGAAYRRGRRTVSYLTLPKRCPKGGFSIKSELRFASGETTTVMYKGPCPGPSRK
jgi:hypothetical protein